MTGLGPWRCSTRPAEMPASAPARLPAEKAVVTAVADQPVSSEIAGASTVKA